MTHNHKRTYEIT